MLRTKISYITQADLGGSLPAFIVHQATLRQPLLIAPLAKFIQEKRDLGPYLKEREEVMRSYEERLRNEVYIRYEAPLKPLVVRKPK